MNLTWYYSRTILAIWTNYQGVNAHVYVENMGWRKLYNGDDDATLAMLAVCVRAKAEGANQFFFALNTNNEIGAVAVI